MTGPIDPPASPPVSPPVGGTPPASDPPVSPPAGGTPPAGDTVTPAGPGTDTGNTTPPVSSPTLTPLLAAGLLNQSASQLTGYSSTTLYRLAMSLVLTEVANTKDFADRQRDVESELARLADENINITTLFAGASSVSTPGGGPGGPGDPPVGDPPVGTPPASPPVDPPPVDPPTGGGGGGGGGGGIPPVLGPIFESGEIFARTSRSDLVNEDQAENIGLILGAGLNFFLASGSATSDGDQALGAIVEGNPGNAVGDNLVQEKILGFTDSQLRIFTSRILVDLIDLFVTPLTILGQLASEQSASLASPQAGSDLAALLALAQTGNANVADLPNFQNDGVGPQFLALLGLEASAANLAIVQSVLASLAPTTFASGGQGGTLEDPFTTTLKLTQNLQDRLREQLLAAAPSQSTSREAIVRADAIAALITLSTIFAVALGQLNRAAEAHRAEQAAEQTRQATIREETRQDDLARSESQAGGTTQSVESGQVATGTSSVLGTVTENASDIIGEQVENAPFQFGEGTLLGNLERAVSNVFGTVTNLFDAIADRRGAQTESMAEGMANNASGAANIDFRNITGFSA